MTANDSQLNLKPAPEPDGTTDTAYIIPLSTVGADGKAHRFVVRDEKGTALLSVDASDGTIKVNGSAVATTDPEVAALAGLTSAADKVPYFTGSETAAVADFTSTGRSIVAAASAAAAATVIGVGTGDSPQVTAVNVGHATDTTITRSAAGKVAVEGKAVPLMSGAVDAVFAGPTAARTYTFPDANGTVVTSTTVPRLASVSEAVAASAFTDGDGTTGTLILAATVPAGAILLGTKVTVESGFAGDTTCTLTIGDGSDADRYMTGTPSIFATAADGIQTGEPSGNRLMTSANTPTLTITSSTDITPVIAEAGSLTVTIYYIATV